MFSEINHTQKLWLLVSVTTFLLLIGISTLIIVPKLGSDHSNVSQSPYVSAIYSLEDSEHSLSIEGIVADEKLINEISSNPIAFGHTTSTLWIKAVVKNPSLITRWSINISNRHFIPVEIYLKSDKALERVYLNNGELQYNTHYQPVSPTALVDLTTSAETVLYFKLRSLKTTFFLLTIKPPEEAYRSYQEGLALVLICIGLLIGLAFVNTVMFCSLRKAYLVLYSLQEVFMVLLIIVESGIGINYLWIGNVYINNSASIVSILGLVFSGALYTRSFFDTKNSPVIDKVLLAKASFAFIFIALSGFEPIRIYLLQGGLPAVFTVSLSVFFYIGFTKLREGRAYALPFLLSNSLVAVFIVPMTYAIFSQSQNFSLLVIEAITLLCVSEAVMLCIAVNMRLDSMRNKHDLFNEIWIETLNERLSEVSRFSQLIEEKNSAIAGSVSSIKRLSNTSHDIQHSLYSLRLHLEMLKGEKRTEKLEDRIGKIEDGLEFISNITHQLIDNGIGLITTESEQINFDELFLSVTGQVSPLIQAKNVKLVYQKSNIRHPGSSVIVRRLLENLVRNALRHTDKGEVQMNIVNCGGELRLTVSDTGKGMNAQVVKNLIEVSHSDDFSSVENNGYGLGLSIVSSLCYQAGYKIEIDSKLNYGTKVSILIPSLPLKN